MFSVEIFREMCYREDYASWNDRRVICMRMCQYTVLKCPTQAIFCELFTFTTNICSLFCGVECRILEEILAFLPTLNP